MVEAPETMRPWLRLLSGGPEDGQGVDARMAPEPLVLRGHEGRGHEGGDGARRAG